MSQQGLDREEVRKAIRNGVLEAQNQEAVWFVIALQILMSLIWVDPIINFLLEDSNFKFLGTLVGSFVYWIIYLLYSPTLAVAVAFPMSIYAIYAFVVG